MSRLLKTIIFARNSRILLCSLANKPNALRQVTNFRPQSSVQPRRVLSSTTSSLNDAQPQILSSHNNLLRNRKALEIDQTFKKLDQEVRRTGRIKRSEIESLFANLKEAGSTSIQKLLLIRCCGAYLPTEKPETRTALVNEIWTTLQENGADLDVSHYNALLNVYMQNQHKFSPPDFLAEMEKKGIKPDRVTFQYFIARYCQEGDLENASKILEHMKEQNMGVTEMILNSLITGHSRANDMESAKGILDVMRSRDVEPTGLSYTTLICGYAEKGDIEAIRQTIQEAESKEVYLSNKNFLEIIVALANSRHEQHIEEILEKLTKNPGLIQDSTNTIFELMNAGHDDVALKLLLKLSQLYPGNPLSGLGRSIISHMVYLQKPLSTILQFSKLLQDKEITNWGLHLAIESAYNHQNFDLAKSLLQELPKEGHQLRSHYFWPLFAHALNQENQQGIINTLELMAQFKCPVNYETWREYVIPFLDASSSSVDDLLMKLEEVGLLTPLAANTALHHFIRLGKLQKASELLEHPLFPKRLSSIPQLVSSLTFAFTTGLKQNIPILADLVSHLASHPLTASQQNSDWIGLLLLEVIDTKQGLDNIKLILKELAIKDIKLSPQTKFQIKQKLSKLKPEAVKDLELLGEQETEPLSEIRRAPQKDLVPLSEELLEKKLAELKESGSDTQECIYRLLVACARAKNTKRIAELLKEVSGPLPAPIMAAILESYTSTQDLTSAKKLFDELKSQYPSFQLDMHKVLNLARLMIQKGEMEEAFSLIKDISKYVYADRPNFEYVEGNIYNLLNALAEKGLVAETKEMFDIIITENKIAPPSLRTLAPLIQVHLARDDLDEAFNAFLKCVDDYQILPMKATIMKRFIEKEDMERLQKMVDISTKHYGEAFTLHELALCFLELGSPTKARKVFETPGLRAFSTFLEKRCKFYAEQGKVELLEKLIETTKNLFDVDHGRMYHHLVQAVAVTNDPDKALSTWTSMQEHNITPEPEMLNILATILENNDYAVPFKRPPIIPSLPSSQTRSTSRVQESSQRGPKSLLEKLIDENKLNDAVDMAKKMLEEKKTITPRLMRYLFSKLSQSGQCDSLKQLLALISPPSLLADLKATYYIGMSYLSSDKPLEYLAHLETNLDEEPSLVYLQRLLMQDPAIEPRVVAYGAARNEKGYYDANNVLWTHYINNRQFTQAQKLLDDTPSLKENLNLNEVINFAYKNNSLEISSKLCEMIPDLSPNEKQKVRIYNVHIHNLTSTSNLEEALKVYQEARIEQNLPLHPLILQKLKNGLEQEQKEVPDQLLKDLAQHSSDSSDSSSDDEPDVIKSN